MTVYNPKHRLSDSQTGLKHCLIPQFQWTDSSKTHQDPLWKSILISLTCLFNVFLCKGLQSPPSRYSQLCIYVYHCKCSLNWMSLHCTVLHLHSYHTHNKELLNSSVSMLSVTSQQNIPVSFNIQCLSLQFTIS